MKIAKFMGKRPVKDFLVKQIDDLRHTMSKIDENGKGVALVIDENEKFKAIISDGDIRRWLLSDGELSVSIQEYLVHPDNQRRAGALTLPETATDDEILSTLTNSGARFAPIISQDGRVLDVAVLIDLVQDQTPQLDAVVMAGGRGLRLRPYTDPLPKPMLPINGKPILENVLEGLSKTGIFNVSITTHYHSDKIIDHFGDGKDFGLNINYINEDKPLGTAGALKNVPSGSGPVLVMNGDIVSDINFEAMLQFHKEASAQITIATHRYKVDVPYGVAACEGIDLTEIEEKPTYQYLVNAGIYLIERDCLNHIPSDDFFDMPDLISSVKKSGDRVVVYPFDDYWLDIGRYDDYRKAQSRFEQLAMDTNRSLTTETTLPRQMPPLARSKILITGARGMIGAALNDLLENASSEILTPTRQELDLTNAKDTEEYLTKHAIDCVFMLSGKTGTMLDVSQRPVDFLEDNILQEMNLLKAAHNANVDRVILASSAAVYPEWADIPLREETLLSGKMSEDMEPYGLAKAFGAKLCEYYKRQHNRVYTAVILSNIYGEDQLSEGSNKQFLPSVILRIAKAKRDNLSSVDIWGTGGATRDFLHAKDSALAILHAAQYFPGALINIGSGQEISIAEVVEKIKSISRYEGEIHFDSTKPEGTPRSCLDTSILNSIGWHPTISLEKGIHSLWDAAYKTK